MHSGQVVLQHWSGLHALYLALPPRSISLRQSLPLISLTVQGGVWPGQGKDFTFTILASTLNNQPHFAHFNTILYSQLDDSPEKATRKSQNMSYLRALNHPYRVTKENLSQNPDGIVKLSYNIISEDRSRLTRDYLIEEQIPMHHLKQTEPFMHGFVAFPRYYDPKSKTNKSETPERKLCDVGGVTPCLLHCGVVGHRPTALELIPLSTEASPGPVLAIKSFQFRYSAVGLFKLVRPQEGLYQCSSRSANTTATLSITVSVFWKARITVAKLTRFSNNNLLLTCEAEGWPKPQNLIWITGGADQGIRGSSKVTHTTDGNTTTTRLTIAAPTTPYNGRKYLFQCLSEQYIEGRKVAVMLRKIQQ